MKRLLSEEKYRELRCCIERVHPLVHCITNYVTVNDCANALYAVGARPVMSHAPEESAEISLGSSALVLNLGATEYYESMKLSLTAVRETGIPVVLDPVGVAASSYRRGFCLSLLREYGISVLRGNPSELKALIRECGTAAGVDSGEDSAEEWGEEEWQGQLSSFSERYGLTVLRSGAADLIYGSGESRLLRGGSSWMTAVSGCGCMESVLIGAFLAAEKKLRGEGANMAAAAAMASECMGRAGEIAEKEVIKRGEGLGSYRIRLLDALSLSRFYGISQQTAVGSADPAAACALCSVSLI